MADVHLPQLSRRDTARAMAALGLAASFAPTLMRRRRQDQAVVSLAAAAAGAAAGAATEALVVRLAARLDGGERAARMVLVGAGVLATAAELPRSPAPAIALLGTGARVAGIGALLGALGPVRAAEPRVDWRAVVLVGGLAAGSVTLYRRAVKARRPRIAMPHYPAERYLATVSGGAGSAAPRAALDFEGTRFLAGAIGAEEIAAVRADGVPAKDPVRVFVGIASAPDVAGRAALAEAELLRLGAYECGRILVCSATLRGFVNPVPVEAEEVFAGGDVASVVVQYFDRRTVWMPAKVPIAAATHRELLRLVGERIAARRSAGEPVPELLVYGESLGAWASQEVFREGGVEALDDAGVQRAIWVGTPWFSRLRRAMEKGRVPVDDRVGFVHTRDLLEADPAEAARLRFTFLYRRADPVVVFTGLDLLWRRPEWLPDETPWYPGVTFFALLSDLLRATRWTSDLPQATAHDYRVELPLAVNVALGHHLPRAVAERIADTLVAREIERGARLRAFRKGELQLPPDPDAATI